MNEELIVSDSTEHWCKELYETKAAELVLYGRALGLSHSEAEDVVQETFVALMALDEVPRQPLHYCLRTFRNRALNYRRSLWRRLTRELESSRWFERTEGETDQEKLAMKCLAKLPPEQREVIVLRIWGQLTLNEISQIVEMPISSVHDCYRDALSALRHALESTCRNIGRKNP